REPFAEHGAQADRHVYRTRKHEYAVERGPAVVPTRPAENLRGAQATLHRVDNGHQVHDHAQREHHSTRPLQHPKKRFAPETHSSPRSAALATARFRPAIPAVGEICFGQRSLQLTCVWHAWQPASPATDRSRCAVDTSRTSFI